MQGLSASSKLSLAVLVVVFLLSLASAASTARSRRRLVSDAEDEPCNKMTLYYHDILYNGVNNTANATSAASTKPTALSTTHWKNGTYFGTLVTFDDPMTAGKALPVAGEEPVARAQGFYLYDKQESYNSWFGFSIVFNSTAHKGTINLLGADLMDQKTRDLSVVGGTGDFFMTRGIVTLQLDTPTRGPSTSASRWTSSSKSATSDSTAYMYWCGVCQTTNRELLFCYLIPFMPLDVSWCARLYVLWCGIVAYVHKYAKLQCNLFISDSVYKLF
jgi:hypothetical protein